ncbi:MAG: hypothetical protein H7A55_08070 [Verrucomicrobiaceae bacterium]|nr:hypothetical protein [Verrucomicrobiaceae bacterium]
MKALGAAQYIPKRGRPSKRTTTIIAVILERLRAGHCLARSARAAKVHPKTVQKWLRQSPRFAEDVGTAKAEGAPRAALVRWVHHPFGEFARHGSAIGPGPYPRPPFAIPQGWRFTSYRGGPR